VALKLFSLQGAAGLARHGGEPEEGGGDGRRGADGAGQGDGGADQGQAVGGAAGEAEGSIPGIVCYEIEKFLPSPVDVALNGKFYEGDCYVVLKTFIDDTNSLNWSIYFWIGSQATVIGD